MNKPSGVKSKLAVLKKELRALLKKGAPGVTPGYFAFMVEGYKAEIEKLESLV